MKRKILYLSGALVPIMATPIVVLSAKKVEKLFTSVNVIDYKYVYELKELDSLSNYQTKSENIKIVQENSKTYIFSKNKLDLDNELKWNSSFNNTYDESNSENYYLSENMFLGVNKLNYKKSDGSVNVTGNALGVEWGKPIFVSNGAFNSRDFNRDFGILEDTTINNFLGSNWKNAGMYVFDSDLGEHVFKKLGDGSISNPGDPIVRQTYESLKIEVKNAWFNSSNYSIKANNYEEANKQFAPLINVLNTFGYYDSINKKFYSMYDILVNSLDQNNNFIKMNYDKLLETYKGNNLWATHSWSKDKPLFAYFKDSSFEKYAKTGYYSSKTGTRTFYNPNLLDLYFLSISQNNSAEFFGPYNNMKLDPYWLNFRNDFTYNMGSFEDNPDSTGTPPKGILVNSLKYGDYKTEVSYENTLNSYFDQLKEEEKREIQTIWKRIEDDTYSNDSLIYNEKTKEYEIMQDVFANFSQYIHNGSSVIENYKPKLISGKHFSLEEFEKYMNWKVLKKTSGSFIFENDDIKLTWEKEYTNTRPPLEKNYGIHFAFEKRVYNNVDFLDSISFDSANKTIVEKEPENSKYQYRKNNSLLSWSDSIPIDINYGDKIDIRISKIDENSPIFFTNRDYYRTFEVKRNFINIDSSIFIESNFETKGINGSGTISPIKGIIIPEQVELYYSVNNGLKTLDAPTNLKNKDNLTIEFNIKDEFVETHKFNPNLTNNLLNFNIENLSTTIIDASNLNANLFETTGYNNEANLSIKDEAIKNSYIPEQVEIKYAINSKLEENFSSSLPKNLKNDDIVYINFNIKEEHKYEYEFSKDFKSSNIEFVVSNLYTLIEITNLKESSFGFTGINNAGFLSSKEDLPKEIKLKYYVEKIGNGNNVNQKFNSSISINDYVEDNPIDLTNGDIVHILFTIDDQYKNTHVLPSNGVNGFKNPISIKVENLDDPSIVIKNKPSNRNSIIILILASIAGFIFLIIFGKVIINKIKSNKLKNTKDE